MGVTKDALLDEAHLMDDSRFSRGTKDFGTTSSTKQVVVVSPCVWMWISNDWFFRNDIDVTIYRAAITSTGVVESSWTKVTSTSQDNETKVYVANIDPTASGADVNLGTSSYAIVWKFVCDPKSSGLFADSKSKLAFHWGSGGISGSEDYPTNGSDYDTLVDYDTSYKGKQLLILNGGFRVAYTGGYKSDSPRNYVTFKRGSENLISPGDTVVFKP